MVYVPRRAHGNVVNVRLLVEQQRESKLKRIGEALSNLAEHVDPGASAAETHDLQRLCSLALMMRGRKHF